MTTREIQPYSTEQLERRAVASAQDERLLNERRRHRDRPYDIRPVGASHMRDLDIRRFEAEYLPAAVPPDILEANDRTVEQRLAAAKMIAAVEGVLVQ